MHTAGPPVLPTRTQWHPPAVSVMQQPYAGRDGGQRRPCAQCLGERQRQSSSTRPVHRWLPRCRLSASGQKRRLAAAGLTRAPLQHSGTGRLRPLQPAPCIVGVDRSSGSLHRRMSLATNSVSSSPARFGQIRLHIRPRAESFRVPTQTPAIAATTLTPTVAVAALLHRKKRCNNVLLGIALSSPTLTIHLGGTL